MAVDLVSLAAPPSSDGVYEPHIAIDPNDPLRAAVVATHPSSYLGLGNDIWCWRTEDGGRTWSDGRIPQPRFDGEAVGDPLVVYGPDGELITVGLTLERRYIEDAVSAGWTSKTRFTSPTHEELLALIKDSLDGRSYPREDRVAINRSTDNGQSWSGAIAPNSTADKPALAADVDASSPYRGNVYVTWADVAENKLAFARSLDGGRTAEHARHIGGRNGQAWSQLLVSPDGTVHLLWTHTFHVRPDAEEAEAGQGIFYARSEDGGASFEEHGLVIEHGGARRVPILAVGIAPDGSLLAVWSEADEIAHERGTQARQALRFAHSEDGRHWSGAKVLFEQPAETTQGLPAVAATENAWHVLSYDADDSTTTVRIYSSSRHELVFRPGCDLATRAFGMQDVYLGGSYQVRGAHDLVNVGDYVGLAGAGSKLAAAIVLPEGDEWPERLRAYAAILNV